MNSTSNFVEALLLGAGEENIYGKVVDASRTEYDDQVFGIIVFHPKAKPKSGTLEVYKFRIKRVAADNYDWRED